VHVAAGRTPRLRPSEALKHAAREGFSVLA